MALPSTLVWECRSAGAAAFAGGFYDKPTGDAQGGTDHSTNASPTSITGMTCLLVAPTVLLSASFTAAMAGNGIRIPNGGNWLGGMTPGWRLILSVVPGVSATVDANCVSGGDGASATGYEGGCLLLADALCEAAIGGNIIWVKDDGAAHTIATINVSSTSANADAPIWLVGYLSTITDRTDPTAGDNPTGTSRPLMDATVNAVNFATNWNFWNLRCASSAAEGFGNAIARNNSIVRDCQFRNYSTTLGRSAVSTGASGALRFQSCEFTSPYGIGMKGTTGGADLWSRCWFHDCAQFGLQYTTGANNDVEYCVFETCGVALEVSTGGGGQVQGCDFYNCTIAINHTGAAGQWTVENCIFAYCGSGLIGDVAGGTTIRTNWENYNTFFNVTTPLTRWSSDPVATNQIGPNSNITFDPGWTETTWADLACADHVANYAVTSAAGGFSAKFIAADGTLASFDNTKAQCIRITDLAGATEWDADGVYPIASVDSDGQITVYAAADPTSGSDATGGLARWLKNFVLGASSPCRGAGAGVTGSPMPFGSAGTVEQGAWQAGAGAGGGYMPQTRRFGLRNVA